MFLYFLATALNSKRSMKKVEHSRCVLVQKVIQATPIMTSLNISSGALFILGQIRAESDSGSVYQMPNPGTGSGQNGRILHH